ncbi:MAG: ATP-binding protein/SpoIIE family protein phosphatase [Tepidisphaeraceae bacterium]
MQPTTLIPVRETSQVGEARRAVARLTLDVGLSDTDAGAASIIVTELANNLARYAKDGAILAQARPDSKAIDIVSIDRGPGIADVGRALQDGYSTGGTPGNGLGAVKRLASEFDIYSLPDLGTAILARVGDRSTSNFAWAGVALAAPHETVCGDAWRVLENGESIRFVMADGLGHGPGAAEAADKATAVLDEPLDPHDALQRAGGWLSSTRGAAVAIGTWTPSTSALQFAGVGNISGTIVTAGDTRGLMSHHGIVGKPSRTPRQADYNAPAGSLLVLHSDGLQTRWHVEDRPGLFTRHVGIIAACLWRDYVRGRDDASVLVIRSSLDRRQS